MMSVRAILIDLDGVIRRWDRRQVSAERAFGLADDTIAGIAFAPELLSLAITGKLTDSEWRRRVAIILASQLNDEATAQKAVAAWSEPAGVVDNAVLELLKQRRPGIRLALITNATTRLRDDLGVLGIESVFDNIFNSSEVGIAKPDAGIFHAALNELGIAAGQACFIDDTARNVQAAAAIGIGGHVYHSVAGLSHYLVDLDLLKPN